MNKIHTYFKHKLHDAIFKDTVFLSKDKEIRAMSNEIHDDKVQFIRYKTMDEVIISNDFIVLSDYSFTENELSVLIGMVSVYNNTGAHDNMNKLLNKLTSMYCNKAYLPNDMNKVIK